ncbi:DUF6011 domain-containing protein [Nonomuraea soli]
MTPTSGRWSAVARCRACKRTLRDPESLGCMIGPTCRTS